MQAGDEEMGVKEEEGDGEDDEPEEEEDYYVDAAGRYLPAASSSPAASAGGRRVRARAREEKERTKLRERERRAITGRILAGLRQHGNYSLRARSDINDVIAALARHAGWLVLPDGTTFPSAAAAHPPHRPHHHQVGRQLSCLLHCFLSSLPTWEPAIGSGNCHGVTHPLATATLPPGERSTLRPCCLDTSTKNGRESSLDGVLNDVYFYICLYVCV
ncbi:hypothetical protein ACP4OV_031684 [Aristida adscensionis]